MAARVGDFGDASKELALNAEGPRLHAGRLVGHGMGHNRGCRSIEARRVGESGIRERYHSLGEDIVYHRLAGAGTVCSSTNVPWCEIDWQRKCRCAREGLRDG